MQFGRSLGMTGEFRGAAYFTEAELAGWVDILARIHARRAREEYDLTPEQDAAVRQRLDELKAEAHVYWKKHQPEWQDIQRQQQALPRYPDPTAKDPSIMERRRALMKRQSEIMMQQPLHGRVAVPEIEKLLPPEQLETAKKRREARSREMQEAMRDIAESHFDRMRVQATRPTSRPGGESLPIGPMVALSNWEFYVRQFIEVYQLDDGQQETARSILRDMQTRRDEYRSSQRDAYAAARGIEDHEKRLQRLNELNEPIHKLFEELRARLERIPTVAQREAVAEVDRQRAGTTTRSATATTQPGSP